MQRELVEGLVLMTGGFVVWGQISTHSPDIELRLLNKVVVPTR